MRLPEQAMPCFRDFDRTNFACTFSCEFGTVCAEHTPLEIDIRAAIKILEDVEDVEEVIEPVTINTEPVADVKKTVRKKQKGRPNSRFDIIEISNEEE